MSNEREAAYKACPETNCDWGAFLRGFQAGAEWQRSQQSAPAGYVMVPVEPTPEMRLAGKRTIKGAADCSEGEQAEYAYMQMLAAATKAEQTHVQVYQCPSCATSMEVDPTAKPYKQPPVQEQLDQYDAGLLNDFGGGDVEWWQDYIRAELGRAHDFYQSQIPIAAPQPVSDGDK